MPGSDITKTETKHDGSNVKPVVIAYFVVCSLVLCILVFYACRKVSIFNNIICYTFIYILYFSYTMQLCYDHQISFFA